jgi:methyl-accepting chemotaxis protein
MVTQIATTATEQAAATEEINRSIDMIARTVAEDADAAQQSSITFNEISGFASELQQLVGHFKLEDGVGNVTARQNSGRTRS